VQQDDHAYTRRRACRPATTVQPIRWIAEGGFGAKHGTSPRHCKVDCLPGSVSTAIGKPLHGDGRDGGAKTLVLTHLAVALPSRVWRPKFDPNRRIVKRGSRSTRRSCPDSAVMIRSLRATRRLSGTALQ
jgi:hypothetical protein